LCFYRRRFSRWERWRAGCRGNINAPLHNGRLLTLYLLSFFFTTLPSFTTALGTCFLKHNIDSNLAIFTLARQLHILFRFFKIFSNRFIQF